MKMAAVSILISVLLILQLSRGQKHSDDSVDTSLIMWFSLQSLTGLLLLGLSIVLSASIYLWILRYICIGCSQPLPAGTEPEALAEMV